MKPLTHICNISFSTGVVPSQLKVAKVKPLFKSGEPDIFTNYRPISLLPVFSKVLERLFYNRLINFVNNNILYERQYDFRHKLSTSLAVIDLLKDVTDSIDKNAHTIGVFIDLKKAFDTVDHKIMLKKLNFYAVRGIPLKWLDSYLSNRYQYVSYNDVSSCKLPVVCGVPQGSILGPLLFIIYVNDMCESSKLLKFILFADDTNIFYSNNNSDDLETVVNNELFKLTIWFKANKLSLNISKTNYMLFRSNRRNCIDNFNIFLDNVNIEKVCSSKFLGVVIDDCLSWTKHIQEILSKISKNFGVLCRVKHILSTRNMYTLYCSLILPYLQYCCLIWGNTYRRRLNPLIRIQKKIVRVVCKKPYLTPTSPLFYELKVLKLVDLIDIETLVFMFKVYNGQVPNTMLNMFVKNKNVHRHETRQQNNFHAQHVRTNIKALNVQIRGATLWNNLSNDIKDCRDVYQFKRKYKYFIFNKYASESVF